MAFNTWRPGSFALDHFVLKWPTSPTQKDLPPASSRSWIHAQKLAEQQREPMSVVSQPISPLQSLSWEDCGLDVRIAAALTELGCTQPNPLQRHVVESILSLHHLDLPIPSAPHSASSRLRTGATTALLASTLHSIPRSSDSVSVLVLAATAQRADDLAIRLQQVGGHVLGVRTRVCHEQTDFSSDLDALRGDPSQSSPPLPPHHVENAPDVTRPHVVIATLGRCVTLISHHHSLSLASLSLLVLDLSKLPSSTWLASHHVVADLGQILATLKPQVQIIVRADGLTYHTSPVGKLVGTHQEESARKNLKTIEESERTCLSTMEPKEVEGIDIFGQGIRQVQKNILNEKSHSQSRDDGLGQDWRKVIEEFEFSGLVPEDFLALKRDKEETVNSWADKVDVALRAVPFPVIHHHNNSIQLP